MEAEHACTKQVGSVGACIQSVHIIDFEDRLGRLGRPKPSCSAPPPFPASRRAPQSRARLVGRLWRGCTCSSHRHPS